jgi:hypothetical protein
MPFSLSFQQRRRKTKGRGKESSGPSSVLLIAMRCQLVSKYFLAGSGLTQSWLPWFSSSVITSAMLLITLHTKCTHAVHLKVRGTGRDSRVMSATGILEESNETAMHVKPLHKGTRIHTHHNHSRTWSGRMTMTIRLSRSDKNGLTKDQPEPISTMTLRSVCGLDSPT